MPHSDANSLAKRYSFTERAFSNQSASTASPPARATNRPKQHKVGQGHLHTRNPSYGKNLNKLTKVIGGEDSATIIRNAKSRAHEPSTSPSTQQMKRNSSNISLPRVGSKASIKRNTSNVSLKRNGSLTQVNRTGRPTTPLRRSESHGSSSKKSKPKGVAQFLLDDEAQEDEWTEDSASQSPVVTRRNSISKTEPPSQTPMAGPQSNLTMTQFLDSPPESPPDLPRSSSSASIAHGDRSRVRAQQQEQHPRTKAGIVNADALTSRVLARNSPNLQPQVTSVSATGTPGTHTPPLQSNQPFAPAEPSLPPENGISRFLNAPSSASEGQSFPRSASTLINTPVSSVDDGHQSPPPGVEEQVRRAKSAGNLQASRVPIVTQETNVGGRSPPSYTFQSAATRRMGGYTQAKLDLWRTQTSVEPSHGPPAPLMKGAPVGMLGTEERRVRLWDEAEAEMGHVRRFRNPVVDGVQRVLRMQKKREKRAGKERSGERVVVNGARERDVDGAADRGRAAESRPVSRHGPRSVRFEVGVENDLDGGADEHGDSVEDLLRRLWEGGEEEIAGDG